MLVLDIKAFLSALKSVMPSNVNSEILSSQDCLLLERINEEVWISGTEPRGTYSRIIPNILKDSVSGVEGFTALIHNKDLRDTLSSFYKAGATTIAIKPGKKLRALADPTQGVRGGLKSNHQRPLSIYPGNIEDFTNQRVPPGNNFVGRVGPEWQQALDSCLKYAGDDDGGFTLLQCEGGVLTIACNSKDNNYAYLVNKVCVTEARDFTINIENKQYHRLLNQNESTFELYLDDREEWLTVKSEGMVSSVKALQPACSLSRAVSLTNTPYSEESNPKLVGGRGVSLEELYAALNIQAPSEGYSREVVIYESTDEETSVRELTLIPANNISNSSYSIIGVIPNPELTYGSIYPASLDYGPMIKGVAVLKYLASKAKVPTSAKLQQLEFKREVGSTIYFFALSLEHELKNIDTKLVYALRSADLKQLDSDD